MADISRLMASSCSGQPQEKLYSHFFEFGRERRTQEEVKQWYQLLQGEQLPTEFLSIAYMKDQATNFEHEFLLIYLSPIDKDTPDDYSFVCRVERTSNGSRSQALLNGDYSHDTVMIFSKDAYTKFELSYPCPVHRVLDIRFQRRLDLLRILELYYSLQESDTSARYTLFQFNCYFMCWMILTNLVRGIDKWSDRLDTDMWGRIVTQQLPQLIDTWVLRDLDNAPSYYTCNPPATTKHFSSPQFPLNDIAQYLCFRTLKVVIGSESDRVVKTITSSIQTELRSARDQLLDTIDSHNSANLFPSDTQLYEAVRQGLSAHSSTAATKALQQDKCAGQRLWSLLSDSDSTHGGLTDAFSPDFEAKIAKKLHKMWFGYMWGYLGSDKFWSTVQRETPASRPSQLNQYFELVPLVPQLRIWRESYEYAVVEILGSCPNGYLNLCPLPNKIRANTIGSHQY